MHEERKLKEAQFFLGEMHARQRDPSAFIHLLSGFLSAARSVAQYAREEAKGKANGLAWYNAEVGNRALIGYFKTERDVNIHTKPVDPKAVWKMAGSIPMVISGGADYGIKFFDAKGELVELKFEAPPAPPPLPAPAQQQPEVRYEFNGRPNDSILTLCESYLKELEALIQSGQKAGFLSP